MSIDVALVQLTFEQSIRETLWVWLVIITKDTISHETYLSSGFYSLSALLFQNIPLALDLDAGCFIDVSIRTGLHNSAFWLFLIFFSPHILQRKVSLVRGENYTYLWA